MAEISDTPASAAAPHSGDTNMTGKVRQAVFWRTGTQLLAQSISWGATLVVIRLLDPADYGLYAMAAVMMTVLDFLNGYGFASALIQSRDLATHAIRQALGITMLLNGAMALGQYLLAPLVAAYYGKPEVADLLRILCLVYLATPFIIVPEVLLSRGLDFKRQAMVNLGAAMVGAIASLALALAGYGVWTLVYAPMAAIAVRALGLTLAAGLFVLPTFNLRGSGHIVRFGAAMMASHLFWVVQTQGDIFIAGRRFAPHDVGLYAEALFLTQLVMAKFVPALNQVAFPAYARMQDDLPALRWGFKGAIRFIMLATAPIYLGLAACAPALVETLFGTKWLGMVPLIRIMALAMPLMTVQVLFAPLHNALGRPDLSWRSSAGGAAIFLTGFLIGAQWGTMGIAAAWVVGAPLLLAWTVHLGQPVTRIGYGDVAESVLRALCAAVGMAVVVATLPLVAGPGLAAPMLLAAQVVLGGVTYLALALAIDRATVLRAIGLLRGRGQAAVA